MISNSEYWNDIQSLDFDDLFSSPFKFISQNDNDQYPIVHDDSMQEKIFLSSGVNDLKLYSVFFLHNICHNISHFFY